MKRLLAAAMLACATLAHGAPLSSGDVTQLQRKTDEGDARAAFYLGRMYRNGIGVPADARRAFELIEMAALKRHAPAMFILSNMLAAGEGCVADEQRARSWLEAAAELDHPEALQQLGLTLNIGAMGYPVDQVRAAQLLRNAAHAMKHRH
ncbi:MAG: tetratricopeptide repeat protein [Pseudomonadota bacterium]